MKLSVLKDIMFLNTLKNNFKNFVNKNVYFNVYVYVLTNKLMQM